MRSKWQSFLISSGVTLLLYPQAWRVLSRVMLINILVVVQVVSGPGAVVNVGAKLSGVSSGWRDSRSICWSVGCLLCAAADHVACCLCLRSTCKSLGTYHNVSFTIQLCYQSISACVKTGILYATINWSDLCYLCTRALLQRAVVVCVAGINRTGNNNRG